MTDQFKNDLSAAERLADLVRPPSFDEAPTTARPITPDDWYDDLEDFEAHLEYMEPLKGRDRWTPAELGALLLPPLKLEMLLSHTAPQDLARLHPGLGNPVRDAVAKGALSSQTVEGRITVEPSEGIAWALSQGCRLPAEIVALVYRGGHAGASEQVHPSDADMQEVTIRTNKDGSIMFEGITRTGNTLERSFQPDKNGRPTNLQKGLRLLAYFHNGDDPESLNRTDAPKGILASTFIREFIPSVPSTQKDSVAAIKKIADILGDIQKALNKAGFPSDIIPRINRTEARSNLSGFMNMRLRLNVPTLHRSKDLTLVANQKCIRQSNLSEYDDEHDEIA